MDQINVVYRGAFEEEDTSLWSISYDGNMPSYRLSGKRGMMPIVGEVALHFWSGEFRYWILFRRTDIRGILRRGLISFLYYAQGGDMSDDSDLELYAVVNGEEVQAVPFMVTTMDSLGFFRP